MNDAAEQAYDVVIVGSGAGAMLTACRAHDLGLSVLVVEKTDNFGGTSSVSGGGIWIPNNDHISRDGGADSEEEAFAYLSAATHGEVAESRIRAYIANGRRMLQY